MSADELTAARAELTRLRAAQATGVPVELLARADEAGAHARSDAIVAWVSGQRRRRDFR